jgi:hypothetical protein
MSDFANEETALNIANFQVNYRTVCNTYRQSCYAQRGKYEISDSSIELLKVVGNLYSLHFHSSKARINC